MLIDSNDQPAGSYTFTFESYNSLSVAQSTLKSDSFTINIIDDLSIGPKFESQPEILVLTIGSPVSWTLPEVTLGFYPLQKIEYESSMSIAPSLSFDE